MRRTTVRVLAAAGVGLSVLAGPLAGAGSAGSPVVATTSSLSPAFVTAGRTALYEASWTNESNATLTNAVVVVSLPAGTGLVSADPAGCTVAGPAGAPVVSCPKPNLAGAVSSSCWVTMSPPAAVCSPATRCRPARA